MAQVTMQVPDELAKRLQPIRSWLPWILELSLDGFKTGATETAAEIIQFFQKNPSPREVVSYHVSNRAQTRLRRLLTLNEAGMLGEAEQLEPDELQRIEHFMIMLKSRLAKKSKRAQ